MTCNYFLDTEHHYRYPKININNYFNYSTNFVYNCNKYVCTMQTRQFETIHIIQSIFQVVPLLPLLLLLLLHHQHLWDL